MKRFYSLAFLAITFGGFLQYANAGPVIQSATGTFSGDANSNSANVISITGSGFGVKNVSWDAWGTFEGGSGLITSLSIFPAWSTQVGAGSGEAIQVTSSPWAGTHCIGNTMAWENSSNIHFGVGISSQLARGGKMMWRFAQKQQWNMFLDGALSHNTKTVRSWQSFGSGSQLQNFHDGFDNAGNRFETENGPTDWNFNKHHTYGYGSWVASSWKFQMNSANQATDGKYISSQGTNSWTNNTWSSDGSGSYNGTPRDHHLQDVIANMAPGANQYTFLDDVLFMVGDDAWAEAFISNAPDYTTATVISPIILYGNDWNNTHINGYFHQGPFSNGPAWVQVCDNNSVCTSSTTSLLITIGGSGASTTQLNSSFTAVNVTSATVSLQSFASPSVNFVLSQVADFSTTVSSTLVTSDNKVFTGLNQNTQYYFQSKLSTETTYNSSITTITLVSQSGAAIYSSPIGKSGGGSQGTR